MGDRAIILFFYNCGDHFRMLSEATKGQILPDAVDDRKSMRRTSC